MTLRLGIIGLSDGNGHPYSWSAIFNGYEPEAMEGCGFPVIPEYLAQQSWPDARIKDAEVVAVWTQDLEVSRHIAKACRISHVLETPLEMLGKVDAVLLARDDAETHIDLARPFLEAGLPIYIDKPIALSLESLKHLYSLQRSAGQIFTCSALRYSEDLMPTAEDWASIGELRHVNAVTPKSWRKYSVHIIEPVLKLLPLDDYPVDSVCSADGSCDGGATLVVNWRSGVRTVFSALGDVGTPIRIQLIGTRGETTLEFRDTFSAFRSALRDFVEGVIHEEVRSSPSFNRRVVEIVEMGCKR